jgi:hypothetical protein
LPLRVGHIPLAARRLCAKNQRKNCHKIWSEEQKAPFPLDGGICRVALDKVQFSIHICVNHHGSLSLSVNAVCFLLSPDFDEGHPPLVWFINAVVRDTTAHLLAILFTESDREPPSHGEVWSERDPFVGAPRSTGWYRTNRPHGGIPHAPDAAPYRRSRVNPRIKRHHFSELYRSTDRATSAFQSCGLSALTGTISPRRSPRSVCPTMVRPRGDPMTPWPSDAWKRTDDGKVLDGTSRIVTATAGAAGIAGSRGYQPVWSPKPPAAAVINCCARRQ